MDLGLILLSALFAAGTLVLVNSRAERHMGVLFIVRSQAGIRFIDRLASMRPDFWRFLADYSILMSFGGVRAFYLHANAGSRASLRRALPLAGCAFAAIAYFMGQTQHALVLLALAAASYPLLSRLGSLAMVVAASAFIFAFAGTMVLDALTSVLFGFIGLPAVMVYVMVSHALNILSGSSNLPGVSPLLPSSRDGQVGVSFPGYDIFIPWFYAVIALAVTLVAHEGAHGILTRVAKLKLKSTGLLSILALPIGAFVEPDEEGMKEKASIDRMRIYTMGSFANMAVGLACVALIYLSTTAFASVVESDGMRIVGFIEGYPAQDVIPLESVVYHANGQATTDFNLFNNVTSSLKPGDELSLNTSTGAYTITLAENPEDASKGYIGVYLLENLKVGGLLGGVVSVALMSFVINALMWVAFFNINIALVNLLPVVPFDGGRMFKELMSAFRVSEAHAMRVLWAVVAFTAILLLVNVIPLLRMMLSVFSGLI